MRLHQAEEVTAKKDRQRSVFGRTYLSAAGITIKQGQFTEKIALLKDGDRFFALPLRTDQDLAFQDEIDGLPFLPGVKDHLILEITALVHEAIDDFHFARIQVDEQRQFPEFVESLGLVASEKIWHRSGQISSADGMLENLALAALGAPALVLDQVALAHANALRGDFNKFVVVDELDGALQRHIDRRHQTHGLVGS